MKYLKNGSSILAISFVLAIIIAQRKDNNVNHSLDYVPNKETAIKIAEAIWLPIYGNEIYEDTPFVATLKHSSVWVVQGSLNYYTEGGVPHIEIRKSDCKILKVTHGK
jgi:NTF2 fold immunity protein